ncbi:PKD domain-containing protein [bacterium]|nr:PKD domain-containing protein [bacterium]
MTRLILTSLLLICFAILTAACGSGSASGEGNALNAAPAAPVLPVSLPPLASLDASAAGRRSVSASKLELLTTLPLFSSDNGVAQAPGSLTLTPDAADPAWVVLAAPGLQPEGSVLPTGLLTVFNKPLYVAIADFSSGRWEWHRRNSIGNLTLTDGARYISAAGLVYVAALASEQPTSLSALELQFSGEVPGSPLAQLTLPDPAIAGYSLEFSALGSVAGSGAVLTALQYDFGDGSSVVNAGSVDEIVSHSYASPGSYSVQLRLYNDLGYTDVANAVLEVGGGRTELLVVCNADMPESQALADYYMSPVTGRGIAPSHRLELPLGESISPSIARADYESDIREPIKTFISGNGLTDSLKYILLLDGIPHQIPGSNGGDYNLSSFSSVDSELCTLFSDDSYAYESFLWNEEEWQDFRLGGNNSRSFYLGLGSPDADYSFSHGGFEVTDGSGMKYPLDYLVGRLDAYTFEDSRALVDRAKAADTSGNGWIVYDTTPARFSLDTMSDPVWPFANDGDALCGDELLSSVAFQHYIDLTTTRVIGQESDGLPEGCVDNVIAYAGWGVNHTGGSWPSGNQYILDDLLFSYLPGCAWISYESFNGTDFASATVDGDRSDIDRKGQGQICDFLHKGGTVAIGHVYEPWTIAVGDERAVFYRYCVKGDNWIESAYKGLRCLSWMDVVVGDPLCRVK